MNEQVFVVSWTGNNGSENYYEIFKDIENAKLLVTSLKNTRSAIKSSGTLEWTFGSLRMLGRNFYYDFRKRDNDPLLEIKDLNDFFTIVE